MIYPRREVYYENSLPQASNVVSCTAASCGSECCCPPGLCFDYLISVLPGFLLLFQSEMEEETPKIVQLPSILVTTGTRESLQPKVTDSPHIKSISCFLTTYMNAEPDLSSQMPYRKDSPLFQQIVVATLQRP